MVRADKLAAFFGEEFAKEVAKMPLVKEYSFPPQQDKAGNNIFQKIALELLKENMKGQLVEKGYVFLDDAYKNSQNPTILAVKKALPTLDYPFESNSAFLVQILPKDGKVEFKVYKNGTINLGFMWRCFNAPEYKNEQYPTVTLGSVLGPQVKADLEKMCLGENPPAADGLVSNNSFWCVALGKDLKKESYEIKEDTKYKKKGEQGESIKFKCEAVIPFPN